MKTNQNFNVHKQDKNQYQNTVLRVGNWQHIGIQARLFHATTMLISSNWIHKKLVHEIKDTTEAHDRNCKSLKSLWEYNTGNNSNCKNVKKLR